MRTVEIVLKRTKLKMSLLKQARVSTVSDFVNGKVLGWCVISNVKYMVLYIESTNTLTKYQMFTKLKANIWNNQTVVEIYFTSTYNPSRYTVKDFEEQEKFIRLLEKVKGAAEEAGQFYI